MRRRRPRRGRGAGATAAGWRRAGRRRRSASACCGRSGNPVHEDRASREMIAERAARGAGDALASAEPDDPRVPPCVVDRHRRVAEAADAGAPDDDRRRDLRGARAGRRAARRGSSAGAMHVDDVTERPHLQRPLGPVARAGRRARLRRRRGRRGDVIVCDTGGTSFDVSLVRRPEQVDARDVARAAVHRTPHRAVRRRRPEHRRRGRLDRVVDEGGLLRVGPRAPALESRARPAYGLGGTEPTVTDAAMVLGYLDPDFFLGGRMRSTRRGRRPSIAPAGQPLGLHRSSGVPAPSSPSSTSR